MPTPPSKRNYRKEYDKYQGTPEGKAAMAQRQRARYKMEKAGRVKPNDGKEVDHVKGLKAGNGNKNLRVVPRSVNRRKGKPGK